MKNETTFGERVRQQRKLLGMSQTELAQKVGYKSKGAIAKIEANVNEVAVSKVKAFAEALNTTPNYLVGWQSRMSDKEGRKMENKKMICDKLVEVLKLTRAGEDLDCIEYEGDWAVVKYLGGAKLKVDVTADSGVAMIRDILCVL